MAVLDPSSQPPPRSGEGEQKGNCLTLLPLPETAKRHCLSPPPRSGEGVGGRGSLLSRDTLENGRDPLARADAHRRQAKRRAAVLHRVKQRRREAGAAGTEWMSQGDRPAAHVHL